MADANSVTAALATLGTAGWTVSANWAAANVSAVQPATALWANRAQYQTNAGVLVRFTDVGGGNPGPSGGNLMTWNGARWKPVGANLVLDAIDTPNNGVANTTEQNLNPNHVAVNANLLAAGDRLRMFLSVSKNGASDSATLRLRYGPLGTVADPVIATISTLAGTNQSYGTIIEFKYLSSTSLQKQGNADPSNSYAGGSTGTFSTAVAVSDMTANPMFMSLTAQLSGGTEVVTLQDYTLELIATDA